jgi:Holliday junction resolvase RusA-like endonuclease
LVGVQPIGKPEHISLKFFPKTRRAGDLTNKAESVMDCLVDNGILEDDNWFVCGSLWLQFGGVDKENPRVEIYISN